jgi:hypothetical protein
LISFVKKNNEPKKAKEENPYLAGKSQIKLNNNKNNNINNNLKIANDKITSYKSIDDRSCATNGFSSTKSVNLTFIKKQILTPIKETPAQLNPLKLKFYKPKASNETSINLKNKIFSKIILNPIMDNSTSNIDNSNKNTNIANINKSTFCVNANNFYLKLNSNLNNNHNKSFTKDDHSVIIEEPLKTKDSDIFLMTQYDEKLETKSLFKKNPNRNTNDICIKMNSNKSERKNESHIKFFSKINSSNSINFNNNNSHNDNFKKLKINSLKNSNNKLDMFSTRNNNNSSFSPDASTKYISINESSIINSNFNINSSSTNIILNNKSTNNINNNINNNYTTLSILDNKTNSNKSSNICEIEALKIKSNIRLLHNNFKNSGKELIEKIENKIFIKKEPKYPLIPNLNKNLKFKESNPLKTIFFNCIDNLNITNKLYNYIGKQKKN